MRACVRLSVCIWVARVRARANLTSLKSRSPRDIIGATVECFCLMSFRTERSKAAAARTCRARKRQPLAQRASSCPPTCRQGPIGRPVARHRTTAEHACMHALRAEPAGVRRSDRLSSSAVNRSSSASVTICTARHVGANDAAGLWCVVSRRTPSPRGTWQSDTWQNDVPGGRDGRDGTFGTARVSTKLCT